MSLSLFVKLCFVAVDAEQDVWQPVRRSAHLFTDRIQVNVRAAFDDQLIVDVTDDEAVPVSLHGVAEGVTQPYTRREGTIGETIAGRGCESLQAWLPGNGAADTVEMMIQFHIGRCHPLTQNRKGQYAVDLVHPYRLVFEKNGDEIQIANILEIVDYH